MNESGDTEVVKSWKDLQVWQCITSAGLKHLPVDKKLSE